MSESTDDRSPAAADARYADLEGDESVIPKGLYCYRSSRMSWPSTTSASMNITGR